ncbi:MAG: urea ABC transporter permease subunit UrtC [Actinomycetota bacterium]
MKLDLPGTRRAPGTGSGREPRTAADEHPRSPWPGRIAFGAAAILLLVVAPLALNDFWISLLAKYLCYAIVAVGIGLAWGQGGMLTLGQGVFFGLGGYCMGMYLKLQAAGPGKVPDFMSYNGLTSVPVFLRPFRSAWVALPAAILLPMAVAAILGSLIFRQRVRGPYFAILTQALAAAFAILLIGQQGKTGGTNGLTNFSSLFNLDLTDPANQRMLFVVTAVVLGLIFLTYRQLMASRYGRLLVAVRDGEDRVRFLGYNPTVIKVVAFTVAAGMAGVAGALFVPIVGIISPSNVGVVPSIEMVIWVAVGGRTALFGPVAGALLVNYAKSELSDRFPSGWLYLEGALFICVVAFAPMGIAGVAQTVRMRWQEFRSTAAPAPQGQPPSISMEGGDAPW